jgi:ribonuclease HI
MVQQLETQGWQVRGGGGVIYDSEGNKLIDYSWGLGKTTNNKAEFLAAYMGLKLAQDRHIQALIVLGDSEIVIKELRGISNSTKARSKAYQRL